MCILHDAPPSPALHRARILLPFLGLAAWAGRAFAQPGSHRPLAIGGTGAGVAPLHRVAEALGLDVTFVPNLGSGGGLKALMAGAVDIALAARPPNDAERAAGLVDRVLFRTPFVWAVQEAVPRHRVTLPELVALYGGLTERWGDGGRVRLVLRPESDSDTRIARDLHPDLDRALAAAAQRPGIRVAITDDDAVADIGRIDGALGVTSLTMVHTRESHVRVLELDGVMPSTGTLRDGRYRPAKTVRLVTRASPGAEVRRLLQRLASAPAREALLRLGCVPAESS